MMMMTENPTRRLSPRKAANPRVVSARGRIVGWMILLVALALSVEVVVASQILIGRAEAELKEELVHEGDKLRDYAERAVDPETGVPYTTVEALLTSYLGVAIPDSNETLFSLIEGRPSRRAREQPMMRLDTDEVFLSTLSVGTSPTSGRDSSSEGPVHWAVFPVTVEGDPTNGALVVIEFVAPVREHVNSTIQMLAIISAIALALAGVASWQVAGRVLAPIRTLQRTASAIGQQDLQQRIAVTGRDDVAALAYTFNAMLDRLEDAFTGQQRFLDDASHELRTPITVIRGHLELMGDDPGDRQRTLELVVDELRRMDRLVDDLALLARAERPDFIRRSEIYVSDLLMDVLAKASALGERKWALDGLPDQAAMIDGQRLTQALVQLAANAVRYTEPGDRISFGATVMGDRLALTVTDEGTGIPEEDRPGIFDRFARAGHRGDGGRRGEGAGLGLAIVASIAHAHGGRVTLDSALNRGSTFTLDFPLIQAPAEGTDSTSNSAARRVHV